MGHDYSKYSKEQLTAHIVELEKQLKSQKYGLYWDKSLNQEIVIKQCIDNIPIFQRDETKTIITTSNINNLLIEGDNFYSLTSLKMLSGKRGIVDIIYIDPPYNTGKETNASGFIYNDNFVNSDDGFYHSKWLNFMYQRLKLAKDLLKNDGLIFISIGDDEQANLKLLCDQIFGRRNFIETYVWESTFRPDNSSPLLRRNAEFIHCYAKNITNIKYFNGEKSETTGMPSLTKGKEKIKTITFPPNYVKTTLPDGLYKKGIKDNGDELKWELIKDAKVKGGVFITDVVLKGHSYWATQKKIEDEKNAGTEIWIKSEAFVPYYKKNKPAINRPTKILNKEIVKDYLYSNTELKNIFGYKPFNNPKPTTLIKYLLNFLDKKDATILDFFAGSGTTGQAVMELNEDDGGTRKFILCTNNENKICEDVTYTRLKTIITGIRSDKTKYSNGLCNNLIYYKTNFVANNNNSDQAKYSLVEKVNELLCIKEDVFEFDKKNSNNIYYHYYSNFINKHIFIYTDVYNKI